MPGVAFRQILMMPNVVHAILLENMKEAAEKGEAPTVKTQPPKVWLQEPEWQPRVRRRRVKEKRAETRKEVQARTKRTFEQMQGSLSFMSRDRAWTDNEERQIAAGNDAR